MDAAISDQIDPLQSGGRILVERKDPRRKLDAKAIIRNTLQGRIGGKVLDISEHGCKLELGNEQGTPGDNVTIKLDGLESWPGVIRWVNGRTVGVQFQWPLHTSVVEHLGRRIALEFA